MLASDLLTGLNPSQVAAVTQLDGPLLVLAGPGSGKTRVITHRIAFMIEQGIAPESILALTFTNKAAGEMRARLEKLIGPNQVWLGTFHGFCVRLLRRYARLVGLPENFSIYDVDDSQRALKAAIAESKFELTHVSVGSLANRISFFKNRLITPEILEGEALSSDEYQVGQVYPYYQRELLKNGAVDFDDLLMHTATLLRTSAELRQQIDERLRYVMVDEYQDTNLAQYVITRHLCIDHPNIAATGDPDQSIYGWRGANAKNVSNLERDYPELQIVRLEENYRSTPEILTVADCLIQNNEFRKEKTLVPSRNSGDPVRLAVYPSGRSEADDVADQIAALVNEGGYSPKDFGILYRTNAQSRQIEQSLLRQGLNYQVIGGFRFYLRKEIKDLLSYLQLIYNPTDNVAFQRAINTPPRGIGKQTVGKLQGIGDLRRCTLLDACRCAVEEKLVSARACSGLRAFLKIYDSLCDLIHGPLFDLLDSTIEMTQYREYLAKQQAKSEADDSLDNLEELLAEAKELDEDARHSGAEEEQTPLEKFLEIAALQADADNLDTSSNVVTLMTLHAAKGLEFPCVFIIAVEENVLPHSRSKEDPMQLEEERRLLFVGITRAKDRLQLSYAKSRGFSHQGSGIPSSFLMELPRAEMQMADRTDTSAFYSSAHSAAEFEMDDRPVEWDELNQVAPEDEFDQGGFDEACQLPPEEMKKQVLKSLRASTKSALTFASQMQEDVSTAQFREGCIVMHETFGEGRIIACSGHGPKRSVSIHFDADNSHRTFRLSHVKLQLISNND